MAQFGMKRDKYDITFSKFIKLRDRGRCQKCGRAGKETSHIFSRSNQGTRCDPDNACLKCNSCHRWWHSNPLLATDWLKSVIGQRAYECLMRKARKATKMKSWDKDYIRAEQVVLIKEMEKGIFKLQPFNKLFSE